MTRHAFDELVQRIDARNGGRPEALERSASAWIVLGSAGILTYLGVLVLIGTAVFALGVVREFAIGVWLLIVVSWSWGPTNDPNRSSPEKAQHVPERCIENLSS